MSEAWREFADPRESARLDKPSEYSAAANTISDEMTVPERLMGAINCFSKIGDALLQKRKLKESLKKELLDRLYNGDLTATAYREAPSTSASPVNLAADDFESAEADWENARLFINGKTFGRVRITDEYTTEPAKLPKSRRGRPGSTAVIDAAIDRLIAKCVDISGMPRATAAQLIRKELNIDHRSGDGFSDINLAKRITAKCGIKAYSE
ncbi:hypothetical protein [Sphingomonas sp. UYEF23]|uniref:hypothetical protein n=1 Tax=Sphingomonas sp. UYEF23 TaxID=1756408 RepID=UPI003393871F